jgi:hypothetical protein
VDWKGFMAEERTWEPAKYLEGTRDLTEQFHRRYPLQPWPWGHGEATTRCRGHSATVGRRGQQHDGEGLATA